MENYDSAFSFVRAVMLEWDPLMVMCDECPDDEYDSEVADMLVLFEHSRSIDESIGGLQKLFLESFGTGYDVSPSRIKPVAERIWNELGGDEK